MKFSSTKSCGGTLISNFFSINPIKRIIPIESTKPLPTKSSSKLTALLSREILIERLEANGWRVDRAAWDSDRVSAQRVVVDDDLHCQTAGRMGQSVDHEVLGRREPITLVQ